MFRGRWPSSHSVKRLLLNYETFLTFPSFSPSHRLPTEPPTSCTSGSIYALTFVSASVVHVGSDADLNSALGGLTGPTVIQLSSSQAAYQLDTVHYPLYDLCIEVRSPEEVMILQEGPM